ncbi:MAG TPA: hypothetical protein DEZ08_05200 [Dehalococcoidia bacterium]|nr:hypothetical protein [Dehalococcoidia bacterium]
MKDKSKISALVCVDSARCLWKSTNGKGPLDILWELKQLYDNDDKVTISPCRCIFGCTYGPRVDLINHDTKEKNLYGSIQGIFEISVRGKVTINQLPQDLNKLIG